MPWRTPMNGISYTWIFIAMRINNLLFLRWCMLQCWLHAYLPSKKEKGFIQSIYKGHIQSPYTKFTQTKLIQSPWHIPNILPTFISFFQCVYASPNRIRGFRVRDERRTLSALSMFSTLSVLLSISSGCGFSVFIPAESLLSISEWPFESLMCLYFLTIEMFLANTFPSLFLQQWLLARSHWSQ